MTEYYTKIEDGKIQHFRTAVNHNGVEIVEGVFYNWLSESFHGCGNHEAAILKQKELSQQKTQEGYKRSQFAECLENTLSVYDKAKWHFDGDFPPELETFQGYVHTGMFLGWLIENNLVSDEFVSDNADRIKEFLDRNLTGSQVFEICCDGVLMLNDISETGNRFALGYFDFDNGLYLKDYEKTLLNGMPSLYHVEDTWENFDKIKEVIDKRYLEWKSMNNKKPFWKFW